MIDQVVLLTLERDREAATERVQCGARRANQRALADVAVRVTHAVVGLWAGESHLELNKGGELYSIEGDWGDVRTPPQFWIVPSPGPIRPPRCDPNPPKSPPNWRSSILSESVARSAIGST